LLKKIEKVVILGLNSRKVYETANPHIAILGHFNHKRELLMVPQNKGVSFTASRAFLLSLISAFIAK